MTVSNQTDRLSLQLSGLLGQLLLLGAHGTDTAHCSDYSCIVSDGKETSLSADCCANQMCFCSRQNLTHNVDPVQKLHLTARASYTHFLYLLRKVFSESQTLVYSPRQDTVKHAQTVQRRGLLTYPVYLIIFQHLYA